MAKILDASERTAALAPLLSAGWQMDGTRDAITIVLKFKNFSMAWAAMSRIALVAEAMDHHPEWSNVYNRLTITLTTHSVNGISELDVTLAQHISKIAQDQGAAPMPG